jgi:hypothetical protein
MTRRTADPGPKRIIVLAPLVEFDASRSDLADMWAHADGLPYGDADAALITSTALDESAVADALRGGSDRARGQYATAIASCCGSRVTPTSARHSAGRRPQWGLRRARRLARLTCVSNLFRSAPRAALSISRRFTQFYAANRGEFPSQAAGPE